MKEEGWRKKEERCMVIWRNNKQYEEEEE
jgi:hypothetical protein